MTPVFWRTVLTAAGIGLLALLAAVPWIIGRRRGPLDVFELVYPFSLLYFAEFGVRALWIVADPEALALQTPHPSVVRAGLIPAVFVAAAGMAAYLAAYFFHQPAPGVRAESPAVPPPTLAVLATAVYVLGGVARLPFLLKGWFMSFAAVSFAREVPPALHSFGYFGALGTIGYAMAFVAHLHPSRPPWLPWVLWLGIVPLEVAYTFLVGSKLALLTLLFIPLVIYHYRVRPLRITMLAAASAGFLFAVVPLITVYRSVGPETPMRLATFGRDVPRLVQLMVGRFADFSWRDYLESSLGVAISRFVGTDALAAVISGIPALTTFQLGRTLSWIGRILIPTAIWPAKYEALTATLADIPLLFGFADFSRGGVSITLPGELYWNFGMAGVVAGMAAVGLLHRWIVLTFRRPDSPLRIGLYALVWVAIALSFEGWFYAVYANVLRILAIGAALAWLALRLPRWTTRSSN